MALIIKETNSYAFRNNKAFNPWKTLSIQELYHFFSCLIRLGLFKHPPRSYSWSSNDILAQVPLLKNRLSPFYLIFTLKTAV
jgi:Transposase IS4